MLIDASEIRSLVGQFDQATEPWQRDKLRGKLDQIAWKREDGAIIIGDDGADSDEAIALLAGTGCGVFHPAIAVLQRFRAPKTSPEATLLRGLSLFGLSSESDELVSCLRSETLPCGVLDAVITHQEQIQELHPDRCPWDVSTTYLTCEGLERAEINTPEVWSNIAGILTGKERPDLVVRYWSDLPSEAVTRVLEDYALTKHNIGSLNRLGREVHF